MSASRYSAFAIPGICLLCQGAPALAGEPPDLALAIEVEPLPSCVDEGTLERRVAALVRPDWLNPARRVEGTVVPQGAGWEVRFRVFEGDQLVGHRSLTFENSDCAPFQEAVELVLAMLLEGQGFEEPPPEATEAEPAPVVPPPPEAAPRENERAPARRVLGHFRLGGEASFGVLPAPSLGIRLEGGVELKVPLALLARATWHTGGAVPVPSGGSLEFSGYRLATQACYLYRQGWVVSACAGLGFVSLTATGVNVPGGRSSTFDQGAAVFGVRLDVPLVRSWSLQVGTELEAWFTRPEYVVVEGAGVEVVATASGVPVATWLAIGYSF